MEHMERTPLAPGRTLLLSPRETGGEALRYEIGALVGQGRSCLCYDAVRRQDGHPEAGKLKEFFPLDAAPGQSRWQCTLTRRADGQLIPGTEGLPRFLAARRDYEAAFRALETVIAEVPRARILRNFIQHGEILYGRPGEEGPRTLYIWSPGVEGQGFDRYLASVHARPEALTEEGLADLLRAVRALTECIRALHLAGLLHLDISPANFLIPYRREGEPDPDRVSLFDVDSIARPGARRPGGTPGFCAPEVLQGRADNRSDLYSIGAVLYYALVLGERPAPYRAENYPDLDQLVRHSRLLACSPISAGDGVVARIAGLLKGCLARDPARRYPAASSLIRDLEEAEDYLRREIRRGDRPQGQAAADPAAVMEKLLYDHPLYQAADGAPDLRVLVLGGGPYSQRFTDLCLQAGQMAGQRLSVTVLTRDPAEDRAQYLRFRPDLTRFVEVAGAPSAPPEAVWARLDFQPLFREDGARPRFGLTRAGNAPLVADLLDRAAPAPVHYVLTALGSDGEDRSVAELLAEDPRVTGPVCYLRRAPDPEPAPAGLVPVPIHQPVDPAAIRDGLEQMAFNTHISWDGDRNYDMARKRAEFLADRYQYASSLRFALSIRYKLHSVGIDYTDELAGAAAFAARILDRRDADPAARAAFARLGDLEHRRWVLEKVTDGWTAPRDHRGGLDLAGCVRRGLVRDEARRTHPCLVPGGEAMPFSAPPYTDPDRKAWDTLPPDPALDPLDRMSLDLHRLFRAEALRLRREEPPESRALVRLRALAEQGDEALVRAFRQLRFCVKNIWKGVESYTRQLDQYAKELERAAAVLPPERREAVPDLLAQLRRDLRPMLEANLYKDYKAFDRILVERIPFILTYRPCPALALPFADGRDQGGRNEAVFPNVAAATVLHPARLCYLYCADQDADPALVLRKLRGALAYLSGRSIRCRVSFLAVRLPGLDSGAEETLCRGLEALCRSGSGGSAVLSDWDLLPCADGARGADRLLRSLEARGIGLVQAGTRLFPSVLDETAFLTGLRDSSLAFFQFDWRRQRFSHCVRCEHLRYFRDRSFLRVRDMFALMNARDVRRELPEFAEDYETLWGIYTGRHLLACDPANRFENGVRNWNQLCESLAAWEGARPPLALLPLADLSEGRRERVCYLPRYALEGARALLARLEALGAADPGWEAAVHAGDACRLSLTVAPALWQALEELFRRPFLLLEPSGLQVLEAGDSREPSLRLVWDDPEVRGADLTPERARYSLQVLSELEKAGFIRGLRQDRDRPEIVSFLYASPRIKALLTTAGAILEIYTYYEVLKTGYFDDVAWGYAFRWEEGNVQNELDLVLTKGFRSFLIECKAVRKLTLDYYHKLDSLADRFGIGASKILVGNTYARSHRNLAEANSVQRSRGLQMDITTISSQARIQAIGQTLQALMEKRQAGL